MGEHYKDNGDEMTAEEHNGRFEVDEFIGEPMIPGAIEAIVEDIPGSMAVVTPCDEEGNPILDDQVIYRYDG